MPAQGAATTLRERQVANRSSQVCPRVGATLGEGPSPPRIRAWWSWPCEPWRDCSLLSVSLWEGGALAGGKGITGTMQKQDRKAPCTLISSQFPAGTQRALSGHPVRLGSQLPCDPEQKGLSAEELIGTGGRSTPTLLAGQFQERPCISRESVSERPCCSAGKPVLPEGRGEVGPV